MNQHSIISWEEFIDCIKWCAWYTDLRMRFWHPNILSQFCDLPGEYIIWNFACGDDMLQVGVTACAVTKLHVLWQNTKLSITKKKTNKQTNKQNKYFDFYYFSSDILPLLNTRLVCSQLNAILVQSSNMTMEISLVDTVLKNVTRVNSSSSALNLRM